jgi:preprotein translocase subunit SecB
MTDETTNAPGKAPGNGAGDATLTPALKLLTQYLKDLSFENPGAPMVHMLRGELPRAQLSLDVRARTIAPMQYEVSLVLGISAQREQETVYLVELEYAGLFDVTGVAEEHVTPLLMIEAPRLLFPFAREVLAKATHDGGYPPVMLNPIDFLAVFREQAKRREAEGASPITTA